MSEEQENAAPEGVQGETAQPETDQVVDTSTQASDEQVEAQAFGAVFADGDASDEEPPEQESAKATIAGYSEDEVRDLLEKAKRVDRLEAGQSKAFGTLGSLQQAVNALRARPEPQAVKLGELKRLEADYPDLAQALREDLAESLQGGGAANAGADLQQLVDSRVGTVVEQFKRESEAKWLTTMHRDWQAVVQTPEFNQWKGTLKPEELAVVNDSWDAGELAGYLDRYKEWKQQTKDVQERNEAARRARTTRLAEAVTPKGSATRTAAMTEEEAFKAVFRKK